MNDRAEPAPRPTDEQLRKIIRRHRRLLIWHMDAHAAMEARLAHAVEEFYKLERRYGAGTERTPPKPLGEMPGSIRKMEADA